MLRLLFLFPYFFFVHSFHINSCLLFLFDCFLFFFHLLLVLLLSVLNIFSCISCFIINVNIFRWFVSLAFPICTCQLLIPQVVAFFPDSAQLIPPYSFLLRQVFRPFHWCFRCWIHFSLLPNTTLRKRGSYVKFLMVAEVQSVELLT